MSAPSDTINIMAMTPLVVLNVSATAYCMFYFLMNNKLDVKLLQARPISYLTVILSFMSALEGVFLIQFSKRYRNCKLKFLF